jgi:hypothetical protein
MRRSWAPVLAVILLRAAPALAAEPLDLDLARLGAPSADVWKNLGCYATGVYPCTVPQAYLDGAQQASLDARQRFALLSSEMALALTNTLLEPASTTGMSGFDVSAEAGYAQVHTDVIGRSAIPGAADPAKYWPTHTMTPHELFVPSVHVRKALPFSFEVGGRILYLSQSSYFAAQIEGRWALNEGMAGIPDLAVRVARTQLYGQRDWRLGATDVDLVVSKRFGVNGVTSFTPYAGARFTFLDASTAVMDFGPARPAGTPPEQAENTQAAFPTLNAIFYRTTVGIRMTSYLVSMAGEVTYGAGGTFGKDSPAADQYPKYKVRSSLGGAFRFGFEF